MSLLSNFLRPFTWRRFTRPGITGPRNGKKWIDANPNATTKEVYQQAGRMMDEYGIDHVPLVRY